MKKINLKYLKDNINLKELIKELDKLERSGNEDMIRNAVLNSYPDILDHNDCLGSKTGV